MSRFLVSALVDFTWFDGSAEEVLAEWGFDVLEHEMDPYRNGIEEMPTEFVTMFSVPLRSDSLNHIANFLEMDPDLDKGDVLDLIRSAEIVD